MLTAGADLKGLEQAPEGWAALSGEPRVAAQAAAIAKIRFQLSRVETVLSADKPALTDQEVRTGQHNTRPP